jgi:hypothetical protein
MRDRNLWRVWPSGRWASIAGSLERSHNPKVAGSMLAPAAKKALGVPICAEGFLVSGIAE